MGSSLKEVASAKVSAAKDTAKEAVKAAEGVASKVRCSFQLFIITRLALLCCGTTASVLLHYRCAGRYTISHISLNTAPDKCCGVLQLTKEVAIEADTAKDKVMEVVEELVRSCLIRSPSSLHVVCVSLHQAGGSTQQKLQQTPHATYSPALCSFMWSLAAIAQCHPQPKS